MIAAVIGRWLVVAVVLGALAPATAGAMPLRGAPWQPGAQAAERFARERAGIVSFHVRHGGRRWGHQAGRVTYTASTIKTMLALVYLRRPGTRRRALTARDRALLDPMIRRSGNVAATRVRDIVGNHRLTALAAKIGMRDFHVHPNWGASTISARDLSRLFARLDALTPRRHRAYLLRLHRTIVARQRWGVGQVQPDGWKLYFKGGWGSGSGAVDHQAALLTRDGRRIALAITTVANPDHAYGKRTLEGVAKRLLRGL
jgi:hypothetical protein